MSGFVLSAAVFIALTANGTAWADAFNIRPAAPGPIGTPLLQNVFNNIGSSINAVTDQDAAALFQPMSIGGTLNSLFFENPSAAYRNSNKFGIYSTDNPNLKLQIFSGADGPITQHSVEFAKGAGFNGVELDNNPATLINGFGFTFGFYLISNGSGATLYSEDSRNGGIAQALIYRGKGNKVNLFEANDNVLGCHGGPGPIPCLSDANSWYIAFEDLAGGGDHNYSDMVVQVDDIQPVPEPGSMALFGTGLLWVAGKARRRGKK